MRQRSAFDSGFEGCFGVLCAFAFVAALLMIGLFVLTIGGCLVMIGAS